MKRTNDDRVQRIALELSLKPFGTNDGRSFDECARHVITAWRPLCEAGREVSFMLWVGDGGDILDWSGDVSQRLEWGRYIGFNNQDRDTYDPGHHAPGRAAIPYVENPREMTFADLRDIIATLRRVGTELLGRPVSIGATFDPGPEFADAPFKYERHREIVVPKRVSGRPTFPMVDATATLHADPTSYASYPNGIPEGESFARFLGRQIAAYCRDFGVDYVWLSNGFGFSAVAWDYLGPAFDGERFHPEVRAEQLERFKQAWIDLREGNPNVPMEVRGSNFAAGMDIAKDAVDFKWLYEEGFTRLPPPNSPWGILNFDYGLELAGYLSRTVKSPAGEYLFRFYPNDPWFWQNPWTDIFYGQPYDIYVPLATSVVGESGEITTPSVINFLTGDSEFGETDPLTGVQVAAHIRTAINDRPDDVGLVTWVYPFDGYHELAASGADGQAEVFFGDWFVRSLINSGLPVASAATSEAFDALVRARAAAPRTIVLLPTAAVRSGAEAAMLQSWLELGVPAILYGPAVSLQADLLDLLGLSLADPIDGEVSLIGADGDARGRVIHDPVGSAGGLCAEFTAGEGRELLYSASSASGTRAFCVAATPSLAGSASLAWIRGTNHFETRPNTERLALKPISRGPGFFDTSRIGYDMLSRFGYVVQPECEAAGEHAAFVLFSRHDNAWFMSGYAAAPAGHVKLRFPWGAPIFHATHTRISGGAAHYPLARAMRQEARVFVQQDEGVIGCDTRARTETVTELSLLVTGLENATVTFFPPPGVAVRFETSDRVTEHDPDQAVITEAGLSGDIWIRW